MRAPREKARIELEQINAGVSSTRVVEAKCQKNAETGDIRSVLNAIYDSHTVNFQKRIPFIFAELAFFASGNIS